MTVLTVEVAVIGAGFSGSLLALMLHRAGKKVVLVEQGSHPRFALGESSTPLTNLALEEVARQYDLPWLAPLAKHGSWKKTYPDLPVGIKRGFTFAQHEVDQPFAPTSDHRNELLVTASPDDTVADTHWLRSDFDHLVLRQAAAAGVPYFDQTHLVELNRGEHWQLTGTRNGQKIEIEAQFVVDCSGFGGVLTRTLGIKKSAEAMKTRSWSIYSHFTHVKRWHDIQKGKGAVLADHPFSCDDAALHHVLTAGWIWVLRFDNGVTSAGTLLDPQLHPSDPSLTPEAEWQAILSHYPCIAEQFAEAKPIREFQRTGILQRRASELSGRDWALISSSAYTLDALFSTGNAHAMLTIQRLARILERSLGTPELVSDLAGYAQSMQREIDFLDHLVHGCYLSFRCFPLLCAWTMYYFTGAIAAEERRRSGLSGDQEEILSSHVPEFRERVLQSYDELQRIQRAGAPTTREILAFERQVAADIAPWNKAGLCDPMKNNMYPFA